MNPDPQAHSAPMEPVIRSSVEHLNTYLQLLRAHTPATATSEAAQALYLIERTATEIVELLGFRLHGHPMALFGAARIALHERAATPNSRAALAHALTAPSRAQTDSLAPPGTVTVHLPNVSETIPEFMARVRAGNLGTPLHVDPDLIDFAFDLRFVNPSGVLHFKPKDTAPVRCVFRTKHGHVISATSFGLRQTLHRDMQFFTLTDVIQHSGERDILLPTLTVNRKFIALARVIADGREAEASENMAFHTTTALNEHLLGWPFQQL